ncbi:MAG: phosphoribosylglycinamide formyltransferase [Fimbriiglobus sp.]
MPPTPRLAVLLSGGGTTLQNLLDCIHAGTLPVEIALVISSRADAYGLERARRAEIPTHFVSPKPTETFSRRVFDLVRPGNVDLVILAGWLKLLQIPNDFESRVLNIHPSLLPAYGGHGMYGHHVHDAVFQARERVSGCTVHYVDNSYDTGPIILQHSTDITACQDPDAIAKAVFEVEKIAYPEAIRRVLKLT